MAKQRYINTRFWDDGYIVGLDPIEKLLFLYFLTNPLTEISGAYEIPLRRIAFDTGIDADMVLKILRRFADEDKIIYRDGWILICNFIKHQSANPKIAQGIENAVSRCPDWIKDRLSIAYESLSHLNISNSISSDSNLNENAPASGNVAIYHEFYPDASLSPFLQDLIEGRVDDEARWRSTLRYWKGNGYRALSIDKMLNCYDERGYERNGNSKSNSGKRHDAHGTTDPDYYESIGAEPL